METQKIARLSEEGEDRISRLSDDLIHKILSFVDTKLAVQTSVLSKRWKLIWTTLPYVNLTNYNFPEIHDLLNFCDHSPAEFRNFTTRLMFIRSFFVRRNRQSDLLQVNFQFDNFLEAFSMENLYFAIFYNARDLKFETLRSGFDLSSVISLLSSTSLHKLTLRPIQGQLTGTRYWNLPALTTLHLAAQPDHRFLMPESYFVCLPSLRTLLLEGFQLPDSISLPALTTLHLTNCLLPQNSWDFPALLTLKLDAISFPESKFFSVLVGLKNLILFFRENITEECLITCPQLVNLEINGPASTTAHHSGKIIVSAPNIRNFTSVGFFPIMFRVSGLESGNIKLQGSHGDEPLASWEELKNYYSEVISRTEQC